LAAPDPRDKALHDQLLERLKPLLDENQRLSGLAKVEPVALNLLDRTPKWVHQYKTPAAYMDAKRAQIQKWLAMGKIRPCNSPWNLPLTTADKVDEWGRINVNGPRICLDPRAINQILVNDGFPIPRVQDILDSLRGSTIFAELDLEDAFLQLPLRQEDQ